MKEQRLSSASVAVTVTTTASQLLLFLMLVNSVDPTSAGVADGPLMHRITLDQHDRFVLTWTPEETHITLEVQVETQGWVGLGFSPSGSMTGADIVMAWIDETGEVQLKDYYGIGFETPVLDSSQDVELIYGFKNDTHTVIRFRRPTDTCDREQDFVITTDTIRVIWAYNSAIPSKASGIPYHERRGVHSLYLMEPRSVLPKLSDDVKFFDMLAPNVRLADDFPTLYWCKLFKIPPMKEKNHFIGYTTVIQPGNELYVHHMLLYGCALDGSDKFLEPWVGHDGAQCYTQNMPVSWQACSSPLIAWAVGSEGLSMPEHVGVPLGEEWTGATYFMLEIHYDNPEKISGVHDSSGLRIFHTAKLRQYDSSSLGLGHVVTPLQIIAPRQSWLSVAHCTASCTAKVFPEEGIKVFAALLHTHLIGRAVKLRHIRDGKELPPIIQDNNYDFNYQQDHLLAEERTILPGDHLITECRYDASRRPRPSFGGISTKDEMCLVFLSYYPRLNVSHCVSRPNISALLGAMGVEELYTPTNRIMGNRRDFQFVEQMIDVDQEQQLIKGLADTTPGSNAMDLRFFKLLHAVKIKEPQELRDKSVLQLLMADKFWQNGTAERIQRVLTHGRIEASCQNVGRQNVPGFNGDQATPVFEPFVPVNRCLDPRNTLTDDITEMEKPMADDNDMQADEDLQEEKDDQVEGETNEAMGNNEDEVNKNEVDSKQEEAEDKEKDDKLNEGERLLLFVRYLLRFF